jgi:Mn-dependent DtxR family transcriptional regulator
MIIKMADNRYEYSKKVLTGFKGKYISIPLSLIVNKELGKRRIGVFSYLRIRCGLNDLIGFTVSNMVEWCGGKSDRRTNGTNEKYLLTIDELVDSGYLSYLSDKSRSKHIECRFNTNFFHEECFNGYSAIYVDEIEKIMQHKKKNTRDNTVTNTNILLVFAYLRHKIVRRPNELKPEERTLEGIKERKERYPEAFYSYIKDIADEIGLSTKTVSKIIDILEKDLKLIVTDRAYRVKTEEGNYKTLPIIFANAYKREKGCLLLTEENYSRNEIETRAKKIENYKINKDKRKAS